EGRLPVRPSSLTPSGAWGRAPSKAGVTRSVGRRSVEHVIASRRSKPGGPGKYAGRSMKRTMQRRNPLPRRVLLAETGTVGGDSLIARGSLASRWVHNGKATANPPA